MKILDRYLVLTFIKIFLVCFTSMAGLYIVIHLFTNLEELVAIAETTGGMLPALFDFYGPRVLEFFDKMAGILVLVAAVFSVAMMQRKRELTAVQAAGVGKFRVVKPVVIASIIIIVLSVVNREFILPQFKNELAKSAQDWSESDSIGMEIVKDHKTGILIRGNKIEPSMERITDAVVQLPIYLSQSISKISAEYGYLKPGDRRRPAGIVMFGVSRPTDLMEMPSLMMEDQIVVYSPKDYSWLKSDQCFVVTELTLEQLAFGQSDTGYESLEELITTVKQPTQWYSRSKRIAIHSRIIRPVLDMTLLLLGLPLIISQTDKNLFAAAGICVGVILLIQVTTLGAQTLGNLSIVQSAALSAWLPALIFIPFASLSMRLLHR